MGEWTNWRKPVTFDSKARAGSPMSDPTKPKLPANEGADATPLPGVELAPGVRVPESGLRFATSRSGGPGGQNVNKVNSKVEVWVRLDAITGLHPEAVERLKALAGR